MTNTETHIRHIIFQNNFIASMSIIPIYRVAKAAMINKVEEELLHVEDISGVEETRLFLDKGK